MRTHESSPPIDGAPNETVASGKAGSNASNYERHAGESVPENIYLQWNLKGSPHSLEQQLEDQEANSMRHRVTKFAGKFALRLGEVTIRKIEDSYVLGRETKGKVAQFYDSVPASIKNLDLTPRIEANQSNQDDSDTVEGYGEADGADKEGIDRGKSETGGGGMEPPKNPPTAEAADEEHPEDDSDTGAESDEESDDPVYDGPSVAQQARELSRKHGIPYEYLLRALEEPDVADALRKKGIEWGIEEPPRPRGRSSESPGVSTQELRRASELAGREVTQEHIRFANAEAKKGNLRAADALRKFGIDLGHPPLSPPDPIEIYASQYRDRKDEEIEKIRQMETDPGGLRASLKLPGKLPLMIDKLPLVGPVLRKTVGTRLLALRIARKEISDRPKDIANKGAELERLRALGVRDRIDQKEFEELQEELPKLKSQKYNDGFLHLGLPRYRLYLDYIKRVDGEISSQRRKLHPLERHNLAGPENATRRRDLAQLIMRSQSAMVALNQLKVDRDDIYEHEPYKKENPVFQDTVRTRRGESSKRDTYGYGRPE